MSMSSRVIARGTWLRELYAIAEGASSDQFPDSKGSSIPSHINRVDPLRPEWPIWAPIADPPCE